MDTVSLHSCATSTNVQSHIMEQQKKEKIKELKKNVESLINIKAKLKELNKQLREQKSTCKTITNTIISIMKSCDYGQISYGNLMFYIEKLVSKNTLAIEDNQITEIESNNIIEKLKCKTKYVTSD